MENSNYKYTGLNPFFVSGFSDAEASFQIKVINRSNKVEVSLNFQLVARPSARSLQKKKTFFVLRCFAASLLRRKYVFLGIYFAFIIIPTLF